MTDATPAPRHSRLLVHNKSGHYVSVAASPCWCGDVHYYAEEEGEA